MRSVGIRELRRQASRLLREVERGERIEVTDRGRPVALLVPLPGTDGTEALLATGRLTPARGNLLELGEPLQAVPGAPLPSATLAEARTDER